MLKRGTGRLANGLPIAARRHAVALWERTTFLKSLISEAKSSVRHQCYVHHLDLGHSSGKKPIIATTPWCYQSRSMIAHVRPQRISRDGTEGGLGDSEESGVVLEGDCRLSCRLDRGRLGPGQGLNVPRGSTIESGGGEWENIEGLPENKQGPAQEGRIMEIPESQTPSNAMHAVREPPMIDEQQSSLPGD